MKSIHKSTLVAGACLAAAVGLAIAAADRTIVVVRPSPFDGTVAVGQATNAVTAPIRFDKFKPIGLMSLHLVVTNSGVMTSLGYQVSNDGQSYVAPSGFTTTIATNLQATTNFYTLNPFPVCEYYRFTYSVTGAAVGVKANVAIQ